MTRIAYFVHGHGKGHAVRTRAIVAKLPGLVQRFEAAAPNAALAGT